MAIQIENTGTPVAPSDQRMVDPAVFIDSLEEPDITIAELFTAIDLIQQQFCPRQTGFLKSHHQCSDCARVFT